MMILANRMALQGRQLPTTRLSPADLVATLTVPQFLRLCRPAPPPWPPPFPTPDGGTWGHYARTWVLHPLPSRPTRHPAPLKGSESAVEPRHCRYPVGDRSRIALKRLGFQHQLGKTKPFPFGIGSVAGIGTQKLVTFLRLSDAQCWTVNP